MSNYSDLPTNYNNNMIQSTIYFRKCIGCKCIVIIHDFLAACVVHRGVLEVPTGNMLRKNIAPYYERMQSYVSFCLIPAGLSGRTQRTGKAWKGRSG